jgi:hypothetical protein
MEGFFRPKKGSWWELVLSRGSISLLISDVSRSFLGPDFTFDFSFIFRPIFLGTRIHI